MGVGIAYDSKRFGLVDCDVSRRGSRRQHGQSPVSPLLLLLLLALTPRTPINQRRISDTKKWPKAPPKGLVGRLLDRGWVRGTTLPTFTHQATPTPTPTDAFLSASQRPQGVASGAFWAAAGLLGKRRAEDPLEHAKRRVNAMVFLR